MSAAAEHRPVDDEVIVMAAVERIEILRPRALQVLGVGLDRPAVPFHHRGIVPAQHVDVGRHVLEVAGIGNEVA